MIIIQKRIYRIIIGGILFTAGVFLRTGIIIKTTNKWIGPGIFIAGFLVAGVDVVIKALKNISRGHIFDENFLMSLAAAGAFIIGEYPEGLGVMLFYQVGELFQDYAVGKSKKSIAELMNIRPDFANVKRNGEIFKTNPENVETGEVIIVKPGEKIPLDGKVTGGNSMADTSALTGEAVPREIFTGSEVLGGYINTSGLIEIEVTNRYGESTVNKIFNLVEDAVTKKTKSENFITKFAGYYTPVVVILALLISFGPFFLINGADLKEWVYRGLTFLVVSCPCALVISIPLSFFGGIGGASKIGILVKGSNYLEALTKTETVVFDKTGTLTKGVFEVREIHANKNINDEKLLELAAYAENYSNHPISFSLKKAYKNKIDTAKITKTEEISGHGIKAVIEGKTVLAGNAKLMEKYKIGCCEKNIDGTIVHVAVEGIYAGYILIADKIKEDSRKAVGTLKKTGIKNIVMLTGDSKNIGEKVARELGIDKVYTELLPDGKIDKLELLLSQKSAKGKLVFVGDGINDAPVLARSDIGIAMGSLGSDAAIEAADIVIMTDEPSKINAAVKISKRTVSIVKQNIVFSLGVKFTLLILAAAGIASMWAGVFADAGVTVLAVFNAARALNAKKL